jgi:hypothetical protein
MVTYLEAGDCKAEYVHELNDTQRCFQRKVPQKTELRLLLSDAPPPSVLSFYGIKIASAATTKISKKIHANLRAVWRRGRPLMERQCGVSQSPTNVAARFLRQLRGISHTRILF